MADDDLNQDLPEATLPWQPPPATEEALPERLRVHTLARVLGTTSKRVLDALNELDGRSRSAQSSVDQADAIRVREVLAAADENAAEADAEPESRLILETHETAPHETAPYETAPHETAAPTEVPAYMPLFVAPQPVAPSSASVETAAQDVAEDGDQGE